MTVSDLDLVRRTQQHRDHYAYSQLVRRYQSRLRTSLRGWCRGDHALAEDLAQEAFIKAYQALGNFRGEAQFGTWLYRIAYNVMVSQRRKQATGTGDTASELPEVPTEPQRADIARDLDTAMAQLSEPQRVAIHLCLQRGFSHQEAAQIMDIPLGSVKTHVLRGKQKLQSLLAPWREVESHV
ncbi:sigma-70 family RNA polymerase sigma factor [Exilibacterium tricleocarpae]|uniref:RNA polymerase sigma factor n=1 Tax=Exilibacterium tricleocarpae TaxID=2591008 RepID=A0A545U5D9_9GAMM|nr:sigma-70 family RNA polymerase sigma factor [Exilibacterium tricleocarpae]TQV84623.1 sigma-70 family RNA polymerase sigma factor [Exilibacterium tricleocarpae]